MISCKHNAFIFVFAIKKIFLYFFRIDNINLIPFIFLSYGFILLYSNVIRQGMALSIMLLGISYYLDNKNKSSLVCITLSTGIHTSALILCVPIVIDIIKKNKFHTIFIFSLFILLIINTLNLNDYIINKYISYDGVSNKFIAYKLFISFLPFVIYPFTFVGKRYLKFFLPIYISALVLILNPKLLSRVLLYTEILSYIYFYYIYIMTNMKENKIKYIFTFIITIPIILILINTKSISGLFIF